LRPGPVDLVVFAPHPDDDVIGTGGVIQQAVAAGRRVRVVFSTSGDGYPLAAARLASKRLAAIGPEDFLRLGETRRAEAVAAGAILGLAEADQVFLGFPDGSFQRLWSDGAAVVRSPLTGLDASPTTGVPYTRAGAQEQFAEVLLASRAAEVYVTDRADEHADHAATFEFVAEGMKATRSDARLLTFMVHAGNDRWPDPGPRYETKLIDGVVYPQGISWPPPVRIPLTEEQSAVKVRALEAHASQWALDHGYLGTFVKSEEVFWG
jgi:LmbE family N-acetylglucosaminyl deacetylase